MSDLGDRLRSVFGETRLRCDAPLAPLTTFRVGGVADWLLETRTSEELVEALQLAREAHVPATILGGGSNVLVSDSGIRGVVIRPRARAIDRIDLHEVRAESGVTINGLVRWTIANGAAGLEAWAGTPGTVGGAVSGNAHFGGRLIGDRVTSVRLVGYDGLPFDVPHGEMAFGYDRSRLQRTKEVLLSATFRVESGEPAVLRACARQSLAYRKRTQPLDSPSAGCVFRNPEPGRDQVPEGMAWSAGALIDRAGLKGFTIGGARVSPTHGNFIVNDGFATASDIRRLIEHCRATVKAQLGVELREELVYLGDT